MSGSIAGPDLAKYSELWSFVAARLDSAMASIFGRSDTRPALPAGSLRSQRTPVAWRIPRPTRRDRAPSVPVASSGASAE
ncbi:hypothetical protein EVG20_g9640 [Dentipellis fragilis]|uniref:Uncharacterized protein n=1 Tax=Dentipellis fragilis TaxID=205917 RepID=A0A4Y9XWW1_9AGAM|nr:hypothetical protein EVG20_g9640 [Dentipellis fragilis]